MARKKKEKKSLNPLKKIRRETAMAIYAVVLFVLGVFLILGSFGKAGVLGQAVYNALSGILGIGYFLLPILSFVLSISFLQSDEEKKGGVGFTKGLGSFLFFFSSLGIVDLLSQKGGLLGQFVSGIFVKFLDFYGGLSIMIALFAISLLIIFEAKLSKDSLFFWRRWRKEDDFDEYEEGEVYLSEEDIEDEEEIDETPTETVEKDPLINNFSDKLKKASGAIFSGSSQKDYTPPPLSLLEGDKGRPGVGDIKANANIIKRTLKNFGIDVEMDEISIGPSVTRYALKPAEGVKLSRIAALKSDLSLALAAHPLRLEAPIPGRSLVGIEIPNTARTTVGLGTLLSSKEYQESNRPLMISLGRGISGKAEFASLAKIPHLLIAGATGSGKSVTIHTLVNSLLFKNSPENLRFIMIDPKRVELTLYNGIPHLLSPVITGAKKAILSLKWAAKEMERRYDILEKEQVRDIESYHENILRPELSRREKKGNDENNGDMPDKMPYIVVIIDELADIMSTYPRELEAAVVRLAQMSRAVGIHLVLSTQRPSVQVITGLIKANIPGRVALQVASQVDSRTILDQSGAETLLGAGDMLYISGEMSKPKRIQSAFISEDEVKKVSKYLKKNYEDELPLGFDITEDTNGSIDFEAESASLGMDDEIDDDLYEDARTAVTEAGKASTSYIQRKLRVGYSRAARLMDMLEERGVIGPQDGSKPREVLDGGSANDGFGENDQVENSEDER